MKGVHKVTRKLAGGGVAVHFYAWRGGPKIKAEPGTPDFFAEWQAHVAGRADHRVTHHAGTLQQIINDYRASSDFLSKSPITRAGYVQRLRKIEPKWGDLPIRLLSARPVRGDMLAWRDEIAAKTPREADYCLTVLALILAWAYHRGMTDANPLERPGRVWRGSRAEFVWTDEQCADFLRTCPAQLRLPFLLARDAGQREADILALTWSAYDGKTLRLRQGKTGRRVAVPVSAELKAELDATKRRAVTICTNSRGEPWTVDGFKSSWGKHKLPGLTFQDLRGTAVTRLAVAGCSTPEIAGVTGHSLKSVDQILDKHYLHRDQRLSESAVAKLEAHQSGTKV